jgi:hypothetical protein
MSAPRVGSRLTGILLVFGALQGYAATTHADDAKDRAARAYEDARKAYEGGAYQAAAVGFERVFHEVPNGASLLAAGRAWEKASEPALAADDYRDAISVGDLSADDTAKAKERLVLLEKGLGRVQVLAPDGTTVSLAHAETVRTPANVHSRPGPIVMVATLPDGTRVTRDIVVERGSDVTVDLRPAPTSVPPRQPEITSTPERKTHPVSTAAWITGGAAVASGITAAILAPIFSAKNNDWNQSNRTSQSERDTVVSLQIATDVFFLGACALAATSATLLVVSATSGRSTAPTPSTSNGPHVNVGPGWVGLYARF